MNKKIVPLVLAFIVFGNQYGSAQIALSLEESIEQSIAKNINTINARIENERSSNRVIESRSRLLPQIEISGSFINNISLPTTMIPGEIFGQAGTTMAVQLGSQYNTSASISVNQVLYNQTVLTSLKISKHAEDLSRLGVEKANENLAHEVAKLYFIAQTTAEQKDLIQENISRMQRMANITKILLENGMGKQVDYDRISVSIQNLRTQLSNTEALNEQQLNLMKYMLQIPIQSTVLLTDAVNKTLLLTEPTVMDDITTHIEIQMLESQRLIAALNYKKANSSYLPTLSFIGQYSYQGLRSSFADYFNNSSENTWKSSSFIGLNLSIPIFDGFNKRAKKRLAKLDYNQSRLVVTDTKERITVEYQNAVNNYYNYKVNVERQQQNIKLAESVYKETSLKYKEGLSSMSDLLQDEAGLGNAQTYFLNALYSLKEAELQIMILNGQIKRIINK